jgi:translation initiation factor 2 subunit 2
MKKKKSRKPASDFAKELDDMDAENEEDANVEIDGDLGDDVFEKPNGVGGAVENGKEAWVLEGRDPTYPEVTSLSRLLSRG